jgi:hypothetical protein
LTTPDPRSRSNRIQGPQSGGETEDDQTTVRPFVIEFAGTPRAGKTTALRRLEPWLEQLGHRVGVIDERARECKVPYKRHPDFNLWTASATVAAIIEARYSGHDVLLVDRGPFDTLTWMDWYRRIGLLADEEHDAIHRYFGGPTLARMIDLVLVMTVDPDEALHRERAAGLSRTPGPIINSATLHTINDSIDAVTHCRPDFRHERLDTTLTDEAATFRRVSQLVGARLRDSTRVPVAPELIGT